MGKPREIVYRTGRYHVRQRGPECFVVWELPDSRVPRRAGGVATTLDDARRIADELRQERP